MSAKVIPVRWLDSFCHELEHYHRFRAKLGLDEMHMALKFQYELYGMLASAHILGYLTDEMYRQLLELTNNPPRTLTRQDIAWKIVDIVPGYTYNFSDVGVSFQRVKRCS